MRLIACGIDSLRALLSDLDAVTWMGGYGSISLALEHDPVGTGVIGGDGGGLIIDGVWMHPTRLPDVIKAQADDVVLARRRRIDGSLVRALRAAELERKRAVRLSKWDEHPPRTKLDWDFDIKDPAVELESE